MKKKLTNFKPTTRTPDKPEWPTLFLIGVMYLSFGLLTWFYEALAWWLIIPLAGYVVALFGSLQHEILHGHPTPWQGLNEALLFPSLNLWMPYALYKQSHLTHHNDQSLTDPALDPESFYIPRNKWAVMPAWKQQYYRFYNTFAGRFFWGPFHVTAVLYHQEFKAVLAGDAEKIRIWAVHLLSCALVMLWVIGVCGIPFWAYLLLFVYPGLSLSLIRSFLEHQVADESAHRTAIVESGPLFSLMFLNNNLHVVHHDAPGLAWYKIPAVWKAKREEILLQNSGYYFSGYREVISRYWKTAKESPCYSR